MAEVPATDPLREQLGEDEWRRLTDERARQQRAAQQQASTPLVEAPQDTTAPRPVRPIETTRSRIGYETPRRITEGFKQIAETQALTRPIIEAAKQKSVLRTQAPQPPRPTRAQAAAPTPTPTAPTPSVSLPSAPTPPAPPARTPGALGQAARRAQQIGREQGLLAMYDDLRVPEEVTQGALQDVDLVQVGSRYMQNLSDVIGKLEQASYQRLLENDEVTPATITPEQREEYQQEASRIAARRLAAYQQSKMGRWFIDPYDQDVMDSIRRWPRRLRPFVAMFSPVKFGGPGDIPVEEGGLARRAQIISSPVGLRGEGPLSQFARAALSTVWGSTLRTGGWGTDEQIDLQRRGYDILDEYSNLADFFDPNNEKGEDPGRLAKIGAGAALLGVVLTDIDLITLGLMPGGKVARSRKIARIAGRLERSEEMLKIADDVEAGTITSAEAIEQIRGIAFRGDRSVGNAFANIVTDTAGPKLNLNAAAFSDAASAKLGEARARRIRALELKAKADEAVANATSAAEKARLEELATEAMARVHSSELERLAIVETNKNSVLQSLGLTAEQAAEIKTIADLRKVRPGMTEEAKNALNLATDALRTSAREAKEITEAFSPIAKYFDEWAAGAKVNTQPGIGEAASFGEELLTGTRRVVFKKSDVVDGTVGTSPAGRIQAFRLVNTKTGQTLPPGRKAKRGQEYEVQAQVITDEGNAVMIRMPTRPGGTGMTLKGDAATTFNHNIQELGTLAVAQRLNATKGTRAIAAQTKARKILDDIKGDGPLGAAVRAYEGAASNVRLTESGLATAMKKLTKAQKTQVNKLIRAGKATARASREMLEAEIAAKTPQVLAASIREVTDGILKFRDQGLRALGSESDSLSPWEAWKLARRAGKDKIEQAFSSSAHEIPAAEKFKSLMDEFVDVTDKTGRSTINGTSGIYKSLKDSYGKDFAAAILKTEGDLRKLLLKRNLTGEETAKLQKELRRVVRLGEANKAWTSGAEFGAQFSDAWKSVANFSPSYWKRIDPESAIAKIPGVANAKLPTAALLVHYWNRVKRTTDPMLSRVGQIGPEQMFILKATDNMIARYSNEILDVSYARHLGDTPEERIVAYLDWDAAKLGPLKIREETKFMRGGKIRTPMSSPEIVSEWQQATGLGSPFLKFRNQVLLDTRINPRVAEREAAALEASRKKLSETAGKKIKEKKKELIKEGFSPKQVDEMLADLPEGLILAMGRAEGGAASAGIPKALLGASRMWLKAVDGNVTPDQANALLGVARKILERTTTYKEFARQMKGATKAIVGATDSSARAHAFGAANVGLGANLNHFNSLMTRSTLGTMTADQAIAINKVFSGELYKVDDAKAALEGAALLGLPLRQSRYFSPAAKAAADSAASATRELIEVSSKPGGQVFAPKNLIDDIESGLNSIVKELEFTSYGQRGDGITGAYIKYLNLWKASVTTGLLVPNPRYFVNNIFGDFSQMWIELGAVPAAARTFSNLPMNLGFVGRRLHDWQTRTTAWAAKKGADGLPPIMGTFLNPHLSKIFRGESGTVVSKNRSVYTYDDLRRYAIEDGIISDMISEDVINAVSRVGKELKPSMRKEWARTREMNASMIQHRQRMGLYVDLIRKGATREEAAKRTLRALYDWKHGVTDFEIKMLARVSPFYRFWKLAVGQMGEALLTPFTRPDPELLKAAITGNTRLGRIRQQLLIWNNISDLAYKDDLDAGAYRNEMMERLAPSFHPRYLSTRPTLGSRPYSPEVSDLYEKLEGKRYTHSTWSLPTVTVTDAMEMTVAMPLGLSLLATKISGAMGFDAPGVDIRWAEDAEAHFFEPVLGATFPAVEFTLRSILTQLDTDLEYAARGARRNLSPTDVTSMKAVPIAGKYLEAAIETDEITGRESIDVGRYLVYSMLPFFGTQVPAWLRGTSDRATDPRLGGGIGKMIREVTGFGREIPYDVQMEIDQTLKAIDAIIKRETKDVIAPNLGLYRARVDE